MGTPVEANVSTVGGGAISVANDKLEQTDLGSYTKTFRRTFQHYATNSQGSTSPKSDELPDAGSDKIRNISGWYHIPYTRISSSVTKADQGSHFVYSNGYELLEQGFKITKMNVMQQAVLQKPTGPGISNSFVSAPQVMIFKDSRHDIYEYVTAATATDITVPIWSTDLAPNDKMISPFAAAPIRFTQVSDGNSGTLIETAIWNRRDPSSSGAQDVRMFDLMNGGDIELLSTGGQYSYTYNPKDVFLFPKDYLNIDSGVFNIIPDTTFVWRNAATEVVRNNPSPPMLHLLRVPPLSDNLGNIDIAVELWIEYYSTFRFFPGRYYYSLSTNVSSVGYGNQWLMNQRKFYINSGDVEFTKKRRQAVVPRKNIRLPNTKR